MRFIPLTHAWRMGIGQKLGLMAGFLVCALLALSVPTVLEKWTHVGEMSRMESLATVATAIGAVTHELQKERGMSSGFLGSKGRTLAKELPEQRTLTSKRLNELKEQMAALETMQSVRGFHGSLANAMKPLQQLEDKRKTIDALAMEPAAAVEFYTAAIDGLLNVTYQLPLLTTDPQATRLAFAYVNLLFVKENTGIERAILTGTFAADRFAEGMYPKLLARVAAQEIYARAMFATANEEQTQFYRQTVKGPAVDEVASLKKTAIDNFASGGWSIDAARWFKLATDKIDLLKQVEDRFGGTLNAFARDAKSQASFEIAVWLGGSLFLMVVAIVVVSVVSRSIVGSLRSAVDVAAAIAEGDLTRNIPVGSKDETGMLLESLRTMQAYLVRTVDSIKTAVDTIRVASGELAVGNADLSQRTEEQASALEETASSMEELTSTVKQNAENARQANQLTAGASTMAVKGGEVVGQVVHSMSSINESSKKIADIIGVIDGIAFQTNILALNAAVEAARAGEQGRGFAVVASEVRTLAQRSAAAAKEIKALITDSVTKVDDGWKLVDQAGHTMEEVVSAVKRVTDIMSEIAAASQEQTSGIEQVNQAITQMDQTTQQNAALVEEAAAAAESMQDQAKSLTKAVAIFKLNAHAGHSARAAEATTMRAAGASQQRPPRRADGALDKAA